MASEALERQIAAIHAMRTATEELRSRQPNPEFASMWNGTVRNASRHWSNEIRILQRARSFYWTRDTIAAVLATVPVIDLGQITCHREILFCDFGFCWFEHPPFEITMRPKGADQIHGLSWAFVRERQSGVSMITVNVYTLFGGRPRPVTWASVNAGSKFNELGRPSDLDVATEAEFERWHQQSEHILKFLVCASVFLRQKLAQIEDTRADRHARKRIAAAKWQEEPIISVVHLREREKSAAQSDDQHGGESSRSYHCQWIVQAHVRQQWYPSLGTHLPVLIGPYIKGPEGRPLKPRTTPVFLVDR